MLDNPHIKDADKLISFFSDLNKQYKTIGSEGGLISFCLQVLNVQSFNMKDIEDSLSDLRSICSIISRDLDNVKQEEFNRVVKRSLDKMDMWLHGVHNRKISPEDSELLFGEYENVAFTMNVASAKVLRDDYFNLQTYPENAGHSNALYTECDLADEDGYTTGDDYYIVEENGVTLAHNRIPWTKRNVLWTGNKIIFDQRVSAKYSKVAEKRLVAILKGLYEKIGNNVYNKLITIEEGALSKKDSYMVNCEKIGGTYKIAIVKV